jgi:hypothetical protein
LISVALVLRNFLQQSAARVWILGCIMLGAALVAPAPLTMASATSFLFSEMDWALYLPLRRRNLATAIVVAGSAGVLVADSLSVRIAFGGELLLICG